MKDLFHPLRRNTSSIQETLRQYRGPTIVVCIGVMVSFAGFYLSLQSNLSRIENDFYNYGDLQNKSLERIFTLYRDSGALLLPYVLYPSDRSSIPQIIESSLQQGGLKAMLYVSVDDINANVNPITPRYIWVSNTQEGWPKTIGQDMNAQFILDLKNVANEQENAISRLIITPTSNSGGYLALLSRRPSGIVFIQLFSAQELMVSLVKEKPSMVSNIYFYRKLEDDSREIWFQYTNQESPLRTVTQKDQITEQYPYYYARRILGFETPLYLLITPNTRYLATSIGPQPWIVILLSTLLTGTIGMLLFYYATRRVEVEEQVKAQTMRLRQITETLQESNEQLERFAYIASHDLKAPLRAIDNLSHWIAEDLGAALQGETRENMQLLRSRVRRMERLLDDLLVYSRAGNVKKDEQKIISGKQMIEDIILLLDMPEKFSITVDNDFNTMHIAKMPLQQVLHNLIGNAVKHHDKDVGQIVVHLKEHKEFLEFGIEDDGPGIAPEYHEKIFDMFQTLRPRDEVEGSGVGLALVRKVVEKYGGEIRIESDGRGCTFVFTWPKEIYKDLHGNPPA